MWILDERPLNINYLPLSIDTVNSGINDRQKYNTSIPWNAILESKEMNPQNIILSENKPDIRDHILYNSTHMISAEKANLRN